MSSLFENLEKIGNKIALIDEDKKKYSYKQVSFLAKRITSKIKNNSLMNLIWIKYRKLKKDMISF